MNLPDDRDPSASVAADELNDRHLSARRRSPRTEPGQSSTGLMLAPAQRSSRLTRLYRKPQPSASVRQRNEDELRVRLAQRIDLPEGVGEARIEQREARVTGPVENAVHERVQAQGQELSGHVLELRA